MCLRIQQWTQHIITKVNLSYKKPHTHWILHNTDDCHPWFVVQSCEQIKTNYTAPIQLTAYHKTQWPVIRSIIQATLDKKETDKVVLDLHRILHLNRYKIVMLG